MPIHAEGAFTVATRDESPIEWDGMQMTRARWRKEFSGDLVGSSEIEFLMGSVDGEGAHVYVGVERVECTLHGRKGSFVLMHAATMLGTDHNASWTIVPGSGTGELAGIGGRAEILPNHDFVLEYHLEG
ncbi:MAG: DUF3224 domain-containing protein [Actinobacteria bacterium]|nr:DUF3224 domain-containing protein [Actinomycetota bacterium]